VWINLAKIVGEVNAIFARKGILGEVVLETASHDLVMDDGFQVNLLNPKQRRLKFSIGLSHEVEKPPYSEEEIVFERHDISVSPFSIEEKKITVFVLRIRHRKDVYQGITF